MREMRIAVNAARAPWEHRSWQGGSVALERVRSTLYQRARSCYLCVRYILFAVPILLSDQRRHLWNWAASALRPGYLLRKPCPWITFDALGFIEARQLEGRKVFEYGSGGSTLYWLSRGAECVSIEHDDQWYEMLRAMLPVGTAVDHRLVRQSPIRSGGVSGEYDDPDAFVSSDQRYHGCDFQDYVSQIDEFPSGHFDLVLVDGRARPSCIRRAAPKVKLGGLLVVDNSDREHYLSRTADDLKDFRRLSFPGISPSNCVRSQTDVFVREA